ncbi:Hsp70 family protein [Limisalsivibrio acetivorans]|uniref:Hsp70 family protein n=1 Tax=Limisalsivibrio acetivorans TaxID=1304888 RepID=UPI0003B5FD2B|nr:Hsp70 family protein [Limisalsivibrio acetivorans]
MSHCIGIDFGTSNSMIAVYKEQGVIDIISSDSGKRFLPSVVYFKKENEVVIGDNAKSMQLLESEQTIANIKRYLGTDKEFEQFGNTYKPEELAGLIFKKLMMTYQDYSGEEDASAVITVPAYFDHYQREAVRSAAEYAGFNVLRLLNEPTSAALYYNNIGKNTGETCLVFDLGGGTLDISIIEMDVDSCSVILTGGSTEIGGVDFDIAVADYFIENFRSKHGIDLKSDPIAYQQLLFQAEKAKVELSSLNEVNVVVPYITISKEGPLHFKDSIDRDTFSRVTAPITAKIRTIIEKLLENGEMEIKDIDRVLPVGGASRIHSVRGLIWDMFNGTVKKDMNPEEAVACGAAVNAAMLKGVLKDKTFNDVTAHNLGIEDDNGNFQAILNRNEIYPVEFSMEFTTASEDTERVKVHILQDMARSSLNTSDSVSENPEQFVSLGEFEIETKASEESEEPTIEVTFSIDNSGIISVNAAHLNSGSKGDFTLRMTIKNESLNKIGIF